MNIFVIGATRFVSGHLGRHLAAEGHTVRGLARTDSDHVRDEAEMRPASCGGQRAKSLRATSSTDASPGPVSHSRHHACNLSNQAANPVRAGRGKGYVMPQEADSRRRHDLFPHAR
ncbi:hypothetical protein [Streptomyces sp. NPDC059215]|uniref:hypothetical protein n=1 Tax=Streptomyces sp. NPDC059215 TaxID=3346772 RepID=UPI003696A869